MKGCIFLVLTGLITIVSSNTGCNDVTCLHGGMCVEGPDHVTCECETGFTGVFCEEVSSDTTCSDVTCLHGGMCLEGPDGVTCDCQEGFTGEKCEVSSDTTCTDVTCLHGGMCLEGPDGVTCDCQEGFTGEKCEAQVTGEDENNSLKDHLDDLTSSGDTVALLENADEVERDDEFNTVKDQPDELTSSGDTVALLENAEVLTKDPKSVDPESADSESVDSDSVDAESVDKDASDAVEGTTDADSESIRLPGNIRPTLYNITVIPWEPVVQENGDTSLNFTGITKIFMNCTGITDEIRIHSVGFTLNRYELHEINPDGTWHPLKVGLPWYDSPREMLVFPVEDCLVVGHTYHLLMETTAPVVVGFEGLYMSPYTEKGKKRYILTTMMEPTDARKVFPCFDEPDYKAVFIFNIWRKEHETSLTNLPLRTTVPADNGYFIDIFDEPRTVPMSTYLVAFAIGELDHKETWLNNTQIRTWCRSSEVNLTDFALDLAVKNMEFFEDYFQIEYKLPKQDMIAVPTMSFNAMEHWGLITYREEGMLIDEHSSEMDKEWTAILIAHEVSHMWFGNLVSPYWWDDLWLNEGFATYMMFVATEKIFPDWHMMTQLPVNYRGTQNVFIKDSYLTSHPVYVTVNHPLEIKEIFDLISYAKGAALVRMMNLFLGEGTFRRGLTRYLTELSFKTARHNDLWYALGNQSIADGNPISDLKEIMDAWILEKNYPLVHVRRHRNDTLTLSQMPFLFTPEERLQRGVTCWNIPFVYTSDVTKNFDLSNPRKITWMKADCGEVTITSAEMADARWILGNVQQLGYFRVTYDVDNWEALFEQLQMDHLVIHPINRAQLISDSSNLARAGLLDLNLAMKAFHYLHEERDFTPWRAAIRELDTIDGYLQLTPVYGNFQRFMRAKLECPYLATLTAEPNHYNKKLLAVMADQACRYGVTSCVKEVGKQFEAWMRDPTSVKLDPNLKEITYCIGVRQGGEVAVNFLLNRYRASDSAVEKYKLMRALRCTETPWIVQMLLFKALNHESEFSITDAVSLLENLARTPLGRLLTFNFLEEHWDNIFTTYGSSLNMFSRLINAITGPFNTHLELKRLQALVASKTSLGTATAEFSVAVEKVLSQIEATRDLVVLFSDNSPFLDPSNSL